jgi:hypothetical protein
VKGYDLKRAEGTPNMPVRAYQTSNVCTAGIEWIRDEGLGFRDNITR